jgi:hypothetical protein
VRVDRAAAEVASLKPGGKIYTLGKDRLAEIETRAGPNPSTLKGRRSTPASAGRLAIEHRQ